MASVITGKKSNFVKTVIMACSNCTEVLNVPKAFGTLRLGSVSSSADHIVYFKNLRTGIETAYEVTPTGGNLEISETVFSQAGGTYEVQAVLASAYNVNDEQDITVSGTAYNCIKVKFVDFLDSSGDQLQFNLIVLQTS